MAAIPPAPPDPSRARTPPGRGRTWARRAVQALLTVAVTWLIVDRLGITLEEALALDAAVPSVRPSLLVLSCLLLLAAFLAAAALWGRMVGELGDRDPGLAVSVRIVLTANLGRYLPGKLWQVAGLALLSRREGISVAVGTTAGILGQCFLLAGAMVLGAPLLVQLGGSGGAWSLVGLGVLVLIVLMASVPQVLRRILTLAFRLARVPEGRVPGLDPYFGLRWLTLYVLVWGAYGAAFLLLLMGLGFPGGFMELAPPFAAAYVLGYIAVFAPAGIGIREGFLIAFLRPELGAGAVGVAVLARVWMTAVELLPAGVVALQEVYRKPRADPGADDRDGKIKEEVDG